MPETILTSNLVTAIDSCLQKASLAGSVEHHGMAGNIREIFLAEVILPLLPDGFRAGTGKVIDRAGKLSAQTDIVIYNKSRFSPLLFDEKTGVFPIDSVYYAIEVKTTVTATEVRDAINKGQSMRSLTGPPINHVLFGFRSDIKNKEKDLHRIQEYQAEHQFPPVNIYCVVDAGYCYYDKDIWNVFDSTERRAEVIGLLVGIVNTLVKAGIRSPDFDPGNYLAWWN